MEQFNGKLVPECDKEEEYETQLDYCLNSSCSTIENLDCIDCLFDVKRCPEKLFNQWILSKKNQNG